MTQPANFDPGQTMTDVDDGSTRLEAAADALYAAIKAAAVAEAAYDSAFEQEVLAVYHESKRAGERMPAEDVRKAIAHDHMDDGIYAAHLLAKAEVAAQEKHLQNLRAAVNAKQSVLAVLKGM